MSWRDAPLYVEAHDIARDVVERVDRWPAGTELAAPFADAAVTLLTSVSLALTFPETRAAHLLECGLRSFFVSMRR